MTKLLLAALFAAIAMPAGAIALRQYRAVGTEPFWSLTIGDRIVYTPATGRPISVPKPRPMHAKVSTIYRTALITVEIFNRTCSDGMSDRVYRDTVVVRLGRRTLNGCGSGTIPATPRPPVAPPPLMTALEGTRWLPLTIDGRPLVQTARANLGFTRGSLSVNVGCNGMGGSYVIERNRLYSQQMVGTMMACAPAVMAQERAMSALLNDGAEIRMTRGKLELTSRNHQATFARR